MEKSLVGKYTYKNAEYEYHYTDKLTLAEMGTIAECVADDICYSGGIFNYRPVYKELFIKQYILIKATDIFSVVKFDYENELDGDTNFIFNQISADNNLFDLYFNIFSLVTDLVEHKKQEHYHRDQLSEAIGSFVDVITDKFKDVSFDDIKKELVKSIAQVIHESNEQKKEVKRNIKKNGQKKLTDIPVNVVSDNK